MQVPVQKVQILLADPAGFTFQADREIRRASRHNPVT
jgi:hypothetical protein